MVRMLFCLEIHEGEHFLRMDRIEPTTTGLVVARINLTVCNDVNCGRLFSIMCPAQQKQKHR